MRKFIALNLILLTLTACSYGDGGTLLRLPKPPRAFDALQKRVGELLDKGGEYAPPVSGTNRQVWQTFDLDADGKREVMVFLRFSEELRIYVFTPDGDDYAEAGVITEPAERINSVMYRDVTGGGELEILVGWEVGGGSLKNLSVYKLRGGEGVFDELLNADFSELSVFDMRASGRDDIVTLSYDPVNSVGTAHLLYYEDGAFKSLAANMSNGAKGIERLLSGKLSDGQAALYVACTMEQNATITDIFTWRDGSFFNVSMNPVSGVSDQNIRYKTIYAADINNDGIIDLPSVTALPGYPSSSENTEFWLTEWHDYNSFGNVTPVATTYYDQTDGWYVTLPDNWDFTVTTRETTANTVMVELAFLRKSGDPVPMCRIYALTGDDRSKQAVSDGRFLLAEKTGTAFAARIPDGEKPIPITRESIISMFSLIKDTWQTGMVE
ncbi:hypothetical protein FACS1894202_14290 [Clostridia bacterium]|nr:hypothetical protein FACS1894202_14290 [Clostridia bacterium]